MTRLSTDKLATLTNWLGYLLAAVFVLLPFHAFLTVSLAAALGHYDVLRIWKEVLLLLLSPLAAVLVWKTPGLWDHLKQGWLFWCIACYVLLHLVLGLVALSRGQVNGFALEYSWIINLRPLLIFVLAFVVAARSRWLRNHWEQLLLYSAGVVIGFGLLQIFVLPTNFLQHFGYDSATIMPFETVDQKLDYVRIQSTLRGANPLGAYLVLVLSALVVLLLKSKRDQRQIIGITMLSAGLVVLISTYSRSAYLGMVLAALTAVMLVIHGRKSKQRLAIGLAALMLLAIVSLVVLRDNDRFENTFFHTDETSRSVTSSNEQRTSALQSGLSDVWRQPFGGGPGTAGPASAHNNAPARIAENYYLQIGQEVGWLGLGLFIAILVAVARRLFALRADPLARTMLASLVGISFIGLVSHVWADDTLALLWWGMAGVALAPALIGEKINYAQGSSVEPAILQSSSSKTHVKNKTNQHHGAKHQKTKSPA